MYKLCSLGLQWLMIIVHVDYLYFQGPLELELVAKSIRDIESPIPSTLTVNFHSSST